MILQLDSLNASCVPPSCLLSALDILTDPYALSCISVFPCTNDAESPYRQAVTWLLKSPRPLVSSRPSKQAQRAPRRCLCVAWIPVYGAFA